MHACTKRRRCMKDSKRLERETKTKPAFAMRCVAWHCIALRPNIRAVKTWVRKILVLKQSTGFLKVRLFLLNVSTILVWHPLGSSRSPQPKGRFGFRMATASRNVSKRSVSFFSFFDFARCWRGRLGVAGEGRRRSVVVAQRPCSFQLPGDSQCDT